MKIGFLEGMAILVPVLQIWMHFLNRPAKCLGYNTHLTEKMADAIAMELQTAIP